MVKSTIKLKAIQATIYVFVLIAISIPKCKATTIASKTKLDHSKSTTAFVKSATKSTKIIKASIITTSKSKVSATARAIKMIASKNASLLVKLTMKTTKKTKAPVYKYTAKVSTKKVKGSTLNDTRVKSKSVILFKLTMNSTKTSTISTTTRTTTFPITEQQDFCQVNYGRRLVSSIPLIELDTFNTTISDTDLHKCCTACSITFKNECHFYVQKSMSRYNINCSLYKFMNVTTSFIGEIIRGNFYLKSPYGSPEIFPDESIGYSNYFLDILYSLPIESFL